MNDSVKAEDGEPDIVAIKPDGTAATPEELVSAMLDIARSDDGDMDCPRLDCSGKIEAQAAFWIGVTPEGLPHLDGIGWAEGGTISCSMGGEAHVPDELVRRLDPTLREYCAAVETQMGAEKGEDTLPKEA